MVSGAVPARAELSPVTFRCLSDSARRFDVPLAMIMVIMDTESGRVGSASRNGDGSRDLGPMQVNTMWLPRLAGLGVTEEILRDSGCANVAVAAWILRSALDEGGGHLDALMSYHSRRPARRRIYLRAALERAPVLDVDRTLARANEHVAAVRDGGSAGRAGTVDAGRRPAVKRGMAGNAGDAVDAGRGKKRGSSANPVKSGRPVKVDASGNSGKEAMSGNSGKEAMSGKRQAFGNSGKEAMSGKRQASGNSAKWAASGAGAKSGFVAGASDLGSAWAVNGGNRRKGGKCGKGRNGGKGRKGGSVPAGKGGGPGGPARFVSLAPPPGSAAAADRLTVPVGRAGNTGNTAGGRSRPSGRRWAVARGRAIAPARDRVAGMAVVYGGTYASPAPFRDGKGVSRGGGPVPKGIVRGRSAGSAGEPVGVGSAGAGGPGELKGVGGAVLPGGAGDSREATETGKAVRTGRTGTAARPPEQEIPDSAGDAGKAGRARADWGRGRGPAVRTGG
jgi:hypothetical protein